MAGTFGMKRANYRASLRAGWRLISTMRSPLVQVGTTECSACKLQMEQGTSKSTIHPAQGAGTGLWVDAGVDGAF